jgi:hypothetical protein
MNVYPLQRADSRADRVADARPHELADPRAPGTPARESLVQQTATLTRQLADVMLANVQNTASLNLAAARTLLAHARIPAPPGLEQHSDTWRQSWRSFEVCATSADQMLNLTRGHIERTTAALWRVTERLVEEMHTLQARQVSELRCAFAAMREAQNTYWQTTQRVHSELVDLVQAPLQTLNSEADHGTH